VILFLFVGGIIFGILQSFEVNPFSNSVAHINFQAYTEIFSTTTFRVSFLMTFLIAFTTTLLTMVLSIATALMLRRTFVGKRLVAFCYQIPIPMPHIVIGVGILMLLSQSGLISRILYNTGIISRIANFPILVNDDIGFGIVFVYLWKQIPYVGVIVLSILQSIATDYEEVAYSLGASKWQSFQHVLLPLIIPGITPASIVCFSYVFGAYEVPFILGKTRPTMLSVYSYQLYESLNLKGRPLAMAISVFVALFVTVLVVIYQKVVMKASGRS
jgi:putative spermidine/putrescine transport system permease protein